jgi:dTDP-4-dehydrorhamnose reductase
LRNFKQSDNSGRQWAWHRMSIEILITGGSGFVGKNLADHFIPRSSTALTYFGHCPQAPANAFQLDVKYPDAVLSLFEHLKPTVVIHAAGNKDAKFCENNPDEAQLVNSEGTRNVARACRELSARMIYISTDLVFKCDKGNYKIDDLPIPQLVYGKTKLDGEKFAAEELDQLAICRTGGVFGKGSPLLKWFSGEIESGREVECFTDVFNTPTYVVNLAEMVEAIIEKKLAGLFHTVGRERVSRFQFFESFARTFDLAADLIKPVAMGTKENVLLQTDSSLSSDHTSQCLGITFNSVSEGFVRLRNSGGV